MATELDNCCTICLQSCQEAAYVLPCLHHFCYTCILRWTESKPQCPLCRSRVTSILHSVRADDDFCEYILPPPAPPSAVRLTARQAVQPLMTWVHQKLGHIFASLPPWVNFVLDVTLSVTFILTTLAHF